MKISLKWINDYAKVALTQDELAHRLTMAGLEVEEITTVNGDSIFELEITPNRADCLSMIGMAREIATVLSKPLKVPALKKVNIPSKRVAIRIEDKKDCEVYLGTLIENVNVSGAPEHIKTRINSLGIRPINNLVDVTNFCLMETGQPLHVFDYDKIEGKTIFVRRARKGEKIVTIDDVERDLDPSILIIADEKKPIAIAGIMGGKNTEVTASTKNVLLESAYFEPVLTRRASRKLGVSSDSSYRFERGVDKSNVEYVNQRALNLILDTAKGNITAHGKAGSAKCKSRKAVSISLERINSYLGTRLTSTKISGIFKRLGFDLSSSKEDQFSVVSPAFRSDIKSDVDLIEEIARIIGYDNLPESMPVIQAENILPNRDIARRNHIREMMISQGYNEVVSFSLLNRQDVVRSQISDKELVAIKNPLSLDQEIMRPSMLPSLLSIVRTNINRGQKNLKLFEIGKVYLPDGHEQEVLSIVTTGNQSNDWRQLKKAKINFYDVKGAVDQAFARAGIMGLNYQTKSMPFLTNAVSTEILMGQQTVGHMGEVSQKVLSDWSIKSKGIYFAQVNIPKLSKQSVDKKYVAISEFPKVTRDISLAVDQSVTFATIKTISSQEGGTLLSDVQFCEEYLGDKIPQGQRGIIISLAYQSNSRTLTENEVNETHQKVLDRIVNDCNATIR